MAVVWTLVFGVNAGFPGCKTDHIPVSPLPTTDPGGCAILPDSPTHSGTDTSCATASDEPDREPNGSLFTAYPLTSAACGGVSVPGRLASNDDADMFSFPSCALPFLNPNDLADRSTQEPQVKFSGDGDSEICLFASCAYGPTGLAGCSGDTLTDPLVITAHLAEGMLGCCRRGSGTVMTRIGCDSLSPSASGFIVVRSIAAPDGTTMCHQDYSVTFSIQPPSL
jgi:hypothetical protein